MSFFYTNSTAAARSRRGRDREGHPRTSSISSTGRRHRESSKTQENKSPPSKSPVLQPTLYAQQNLALEHLPSQPSSEPTSPALSSSGLRPNLPASNKTGTYHLAHQPYTPAALQQYLEKDAEDADEAGKNSPTGSIHLPQNTRINSRMEEMGCQEKTSSVEKKPMTREISYRDDRTPIATGQGPKSLQSVSETLHSPKSIVSPDSFLGYATNQGSTEFGSSELQERTNSTGQRRPASVSNCSVRAENFYKDPDDAMENGNDLQQRHTRRKQQAANNTTSLEITERQHASEDPQFNPSSGQRSSVRMSRTFTPPAPAFPAVPSPTPPSFVSPVPLRAPPSEPYGGYHPSQYGIPYNTGMPQLYYQAAPNYPYYVDSRQPNYAHVVQELPPISDAPFPGSAMDQAGSDFTLTERSIADAIGLIQNLHETLPAMGMVLSKAHRICGTSALGSRDSMQGEGLELMAPKPDDTEVKRPVSEDEQLKKHVTESEKLKKDASEWERKCMASRKELSESERSRVTNEAAFEMFKAEIGAIYRQLQEKNNVMAEELGSTVVIPEHNSDTKSSEVRGLQEQIVKFEALQTRRMEAMEANARQKMEDLRLDNRLRLGELEDTLHAEQATLANVRREHMQMEKSLKSEWNAQTQKIDRERRRVQEEWLQEKSSIEQHWQKITEDQKSEHLTELEKLEAGHELLMAKQRSQYKALEAETESLRQEIVRVKSAWDADKAKFSRVAGDFRIAATRLNEHNSSMQKVIEAFGEATDLRSRGDDFFVGVFTDLNRQIRNLAFGLRKTESALNVPASVANQASANYCSFFCADLDPPDIRSFLIMSIVSQLLCERVFEPFLFTLGHRHLEANIFLGGISHRLRQSSPDREALWRQRVLHAAYTSASAKGSVNDIAASIVKEIVEAIEHFTLCTKRKEVVACVRQIVKTAAEAWRYSRLETQTIRATMDFKEHSALFKCIDTTGTSGRSDFAVCILPSIWRVHGEDVSEVMGDSSDRVYTRGEVIRFQKLASSSSRTIEGAQQALAQNSNSLGLLHDESDEEGTSILIQSLGNLKQLEDPGSASEPKDG